VLITTVEPGAVSPTPANDNGPLPADTTPTTGANVEGAIPAAIRVDYQTVIGQSPTGYGTNGWWTDEDADLWHARYAELGPKVVRLPVLQMILEPANDNTDPQTVNWAAFRFERPFPWFDRHITYRHWFETLRDLEVTLMIHTPYMAGWLSANGKRDPFSSFPPKDVTEYGEFVRAVLTYLVDEVGYPPERLILEPVNEADLRCGADPAVPCFWENWQMDDLVAVVRVAYDEAKAIDSAIRIAGLATCCDTGLLPRFVDEYGGDEYLDIITYHRYGRGFDFESAIARGRELQTYGKPVYLNEFGSKKYWGKGVEGALWHSAVMPQVWAAGINPVQFPISEWPGMHQGYDQLGLFADWTDDWAIKPSYWVYVNFYNHLSGTEIVSATAPAGMSIIAGRRIEPETLVVWVTNVTSEGEGETVLQIVNWPTSDATVTVYDNLVSSEPVDNIYLAQENGQIALAYAIPSRSSYCFLLRTGP